MLASLQVSFLSTFYRNFSSKKQNVEKVLFILLTFNSAKNIMKGVKLYSDIALVLGTCVIYYIVQIIDFLFERIMNIHKFF